MRFLLCLLIAMPLATRSAAETIGGLTLVPVGESFSLTADTMPTPWPAVRGMLYALTPRPDEMFVDYGCGHDARFLIRACRDYNVQHAIGVEIDPAVAAEARRHVAAAGLSDRITIITGDATTVDVQADVAVCYLWADTLDKLRPKLLRAKRFASYAHAVPGVQQQRWKARDGSEFYLWTRPAPKPKTVKAIPKATVVQQQPVAVWRGRLYTRAPCKSPFCGMCESIRKQLNQ